MPTTSQPTGRRAAHLKRICVDIDEAAYQLLETVCERSPRGRLLGLARVINRCIYVELGGRAGKTQPQEP